MNLIFRTVRLENFMEPCRDKHYHHTKSSTPSQFKIKVNLLIILFHKMSSTKSLPLSGTESEIERMINFKKFGEQPYSLESAKSTLREKCPNTKFFLVRILPHSDWIRRNSNLFGTSYLSVFSPNTGKYGPEKTPCWTHFTKSKSSSCLLQEFCE